MASILVLGSTGMLGHRVVHEANQRPGVTVIAANSSTADLRDPAQVSFLLKDYKPDVVINCAGIVKQRKVPLEDLIALNSLLPPLLAKICYLNHKRLIHISTDCVFSGEPIGKNGCCVPAIEAHKADPVDNYGMSKLLGEPRYPGALTLRTSFIGRELQETKLGLLEWLLAQDCIEMTPGYIDHVWSGLTSIALARVLVSVALLQKPISGLYHVSSAPINKYALLEALVTAYGIRTTIVQEHTTPIDRSLDSEAFWKATGFEQPTWPAMIEELVHDSFEYPRWRKP
jgi:dTDP-4-dehydrorhamnose reductase